MPAVASDAYLALLGTVGPTAAGLLALFFTAVSVVASTSYAKVPTDIRWLVAQDDINRLYLRLLAHTAAVALIGGGGFMALGCMAIALLTRDDDEEEEGYDRRGVYLALSAGYARQNFADGTLLDLVDGELTDNLRTLRGTPELAEPDAIPPKLAGDPGLYSVAFGDLSDDDAFGVTGRGGYRCHPYVSAELQFETLAETFDATVSEIGAVPGTGWDENDILRKFDVELESLVMTSNVKAHLLTGRYQPFVLAGVGFMRMESKFYDVTSGVPMDPTRPDSCDPAPARCLTSNQSDRTVRLAFRFGGGLDFYLTEQVVVSAEGSYLMPTGKFDGLDYYTFALGLQYRF